MKRVVLSVGVLALHAHELAHVVATQPRRDICPAYVRASPRTGEGARRAGEGLETDTAACGTRAPPHPVLRATFSLKAQGRGRMPSPQNRPTLFSRHASGRTGPPFGGPLPRPSPCYPAIYSRDPSHLKFKGLPLRPMESQRTFASAAGWIIEGTRVARLRIDLPPCRQT